MIFLLNPVVLLGLFVLDGSIQRLSCIRWLRSVVTCWMGVFVRGWHTSESHLGSCCGNRCQAYLGLVKSQSEKQAPFKCVGNLKLSKNLTSYLFPSTEKYFDMKKAQCKEGLDIYKKFLTRMMRISEFLKVAEVRCINLHYGDPWLCNVPIRMRHSLTSSFLLITASGNWPRGHTRPITGEETKIYWPWFWGKTYADCFPFCLSATYLSLCPYFARHSLSSTAKLGMATLDPNKCKL